MSSIVIALPKIEDAKKIRSVLERHGFTVASVCSTASECPFECLGTWKRCSDLWTSSAGYELSGSV